MQNDVMRSTEGGILVPEPFFKLLYQGKDISRDISPMLQSLVYTDHVEGESDTLDLTLDNHDKRWILDWYPRQGDRIDASIGYQNAPLLPCGIFEIDENEMSLAAMSFTIKALSAGINRSVRTRQAKAYNQTTLAIIAQQVAERNQLKIKGAIEPIAIGRVTQAHETDLQFLLRVANEYGYSFTVRGDQLCFFKRGDLKSAKATITLRESDLIDARLSDKIKGVVSEAEVNYHDPAQKKNLRRKASDQVGKTNRHSSDRQKIRVRAENDQQAQLKADASLDRTNEDQSAGSLSLIGDVRMMAGVTIYLQDMGAFDGKYWIKTSTHSISSSGYTTEVDLCRVRDPRYGGAT